jgi:hypothetical protein
VSQDEKIILKCIIGKEVEIVEWIQMAQESGK